MKTNSQSTDNTKSIKRRVAYRFKLDFPNVPFTLRDLRNQKKRTVQYITIYKRVEKALKDGVITVVGEKPAKKGKEGRPQKVFSRVDAKTPVVSTEAAVTV
jgi:hypothetical protein